MYPILSSNILLLLVVQIHSVLGYSIPQHAVLPLARALAIDVIRNGFTYGSPVGGGPYYPAGLVGLAKVAVDVTAEEMESAAELALTTTDEVTATAPGIGKVYNGLDSVNDYTLLYDGEWTRTLPKGPAPGVLTNYSQDLFFSMERLANAAFSVERLTPGTLLPFDINDATAKNITGSTLAELLAAGRLFYADHSDQASLATTTDKYGAACSAYFYIASSGDFLPLAIRTNVGADLIYTPADSSEDWLLAKILFNINDFFYHQTYHLAATHEVIQISWMAAIRTLSIEHPVYGLLNRLTYEVFAINPLASTLLFADGGFFDQLLPFTGAAAEGYNTDLYFNGSGSFQANYFQTNLQTRGLINPAVGPELTSFPYYEDASVIYAALETFMTAFVKSYYTSDSVVKADTELQAWASEANGEAGMIDFPTSITTVDQLVDILTHFAHLSSTVHHAINTNELLSLSATFPMHPGALYQPLPTTKGKTSVVEFLPPLYKVLVQFELEALFARPLLANSSRSLLNMFNDSTFLSATNTATRTAAAIFTSSMKAFSEKVQIRTFDDDGLCQGMPFVWQALDPAVAPYSVTI
ncbi:hypothetical protein N0V93_008678 [Gnomoniopsis smithogilvyi]|uniref:Manganese lipoxygenase n=1 Tax=Gnomoniopsis smithogilvyi TaxID=1191159 RepID=A0A9W8YPL0_9PEZI|nr:hypothetical protein N0V93_008678 [Gnomoniopsis smithogilvyi]